MRCVGLVLLLLFLPLVPLSGAQEAPGPVTVAEDVEGDVGVEVAGTPGPVSPPAHYGSIDLVGLEVLERERDFAFTVRFADLTSSSEDATGEGGRSGTSFWHADRQFLLETGQSFNVGGDYAWSVLYSRGSEEEEWSFIWYDDAAIIVDTQEDTITVAVPRSMLADSQGAAPFPGRTLEGFQSYSSSHISEGGIWLGGSEPTVRSPLGVNDRMPNDGASDVAIEVQLGPRQEGDARLSALQPFRLSNGEATTFVYTLTARNVGEEDRTFAFASAQVPSGWQVTLPVSVVQLGAGASTEVPVVLMTEFAHTHGETASFMVEMASPQGDVGRVEIGVLYPAIPQPGGHHPELFFHSAPWNEFSAAFGALFSGSSGYLWMNPSETQEGDAATPIVSYMSQTNETGTTFRWVIALDPWLGMGLDFVPGQPATLNLPIQTDLPLPAASVSAALYHAPYFYPGWFDDTDARLLVQFDPTSPADIGAQESTVLELTGIPDPTADLVAFDEAFNLGLVIDLHSSRPALFLAPEAPRMLPGGKVGLPLVDYRDPVDEVFAVAGGPSLTLAGETERPVNAGEGVLFESWLSNPGEAGRFTVTVTGQNAAWAVVPASVAAPAGGNVSLPFLVNVPAGTEAGTRADLIVQVFDADAPDRRALVRIVAVVDETHDLPDEAGALDAQHSKGAPLPVAVTLGAAAVALALSRRRQA